MELQGKRAASLEVKMEVLSREYGWTPNQIKELSIKEYCAYIQIIKDRRKLQEQQYKKRKK